MNVLIFQKSNLLYTTLPGLNYNDAASIDHLPGLKSLKMRVRHWGTAPYDKYPRGNNVKQLLYLNASFMRSLSKRLIFTMVVKLKSESISFCFGPMKSRWTLGWMRSTVDHPSYILPLLVSPTEATIFTFRPDVVSDFFIICFKGKLNFQNPLN